MSPVPARRFPIVVRCDGGWRTSGDARNIADNEFYDLENVLPVGPRTMQARHGFYRTSLTTPSMSAGTPVWMKYWAEEDKYVVVQHISGTKQGEYKWEIGHMDADGANYTTMTTDDGTSHELPHVESFGYGAANKLYIACGNKLASYTTAGGMVAPHDAACPKLSFLLARDDQLWGVGDPDNPGRVHRSDTNDTTNWTTANGGYFDIGLNVECTSMRMWGGRMCIFKTGGIEGGIRKNPAIWLVYGTPTTSYQALPFKNNAPDVYRYSHEDTPWGMVFCSQGAIWLIQGADLNADLVDISSSIKSVVNEKLYKHWLGYGVVAYSNTFDMLFVTVEPTGSGYTAYTMLMGRKIGPRFPWAKYTGPQMCCPESGDFLVALNRSNGEQLMCYGQDINKSSGGVVISDLDTEWRDVACVVETKEKNLGGAGLSHNPRGIYCDINVDGTYTKTATIELYVDGGTSAKTQVVIDGQGASKNRQSLNILCETIRAKLTWAQSQGATTNEPVPWQSVESIGRFYTIEIEDRIIGDVRRKQETT